MLDKEFDEKTEADFKAFLTSIGDSIVCVALDDIVKVHVHTNHPGQAFEKALEYGQQMLDMILPEGTVVYTEDKYGNRQDYTSDAEHYLDMPIAVLVNGNSASASEIFAGAIRDFDYGTLIGTTTFGKGIVQNIMQLKDGSAIKLTVAKYYTPNGDNIHGTGITPDVEIEYEYTGDTEGTYDEMQDNQVLKAIEVLNGEE